MSAMESPSEEAFMELVSLDPSLASWLLQECRRRGIIYDSATYCRLSGRLYDACTVRTSHILPNDPSTQMASGSNPTVTAPPIFQFVGTKNRLELRPDGSLMHADRYGLHTVSEIRMLTGSVDVRLVGLNTVNYPSADQGALIRWLHSHGLTSKVTSPSPIPSPMLRKRKPPFVPTPTKQWKLLDGSYFDVRDGKNLVFTSSTAKFTVDQIDFDAGPGESDVLLTSLSGLKHRITLADKLSKNSLRLWLGTHNIQFICQLSGGALIKAEAKHKSCPECAGTGVYISQITGKKSPCSLGCRQ